MQRILDGSKQPEMRFSVRQNAIFAPDIFHALSMGKSVFLSKF
jgi:hypothetical protein